MDTVLKGAFEGILVCDKNIINDQLPRNILLRRVAAGLASLV